MPAIKKQQQQQQSTGKLLLVEYGVKIIIGKSLIQN